MGATGYHGGMSSSFDDESTEASPSGLPVARADQVDAARDRLELLLTEFADEARKGRRPSIEAYANRYPELADDFRELVELVASLEEWKTQKEIDTVRENLPTKLTIEQLGPYKVLKELGRGGMGVVFAAEDLRTKRRVAIKMLPWKHVSDLAARKERFQREASTIAGLNHPNIVPVYTVGEWSGFQYYVMRWVEGLSLDWLIRRLRSSPFPVSDQEIRKLALDESGFMPVIGKEYRPMARAIARDSWKAFARIGVQICRALEAAHAKGVLHYDIKPANLLLDGSGRLYVTDFGVAAARDDESPEGADEVGLLGTLRYMAPERFRGKADERTDLYAIGATLYELATLKPLFEGATRRHLVNQILASAPSPVRAVQTGVPRDLETIIMTALAKRPADRYASAQEMAADLLRFLRGRPIVASRTNWVKQALGWLTAGKPEDEEFRTGKP